MLTKTLPPIAALLLILFALPAIAQYNLAIVGPGTIDVVDDQFNVTPNVVVALHLSATVPSTGGGDARALNLVFHDKAPNPAMVHELLEGDFVSSGDDVTAARNGVDLIFGSEDGFPTTANTAIVIHSTKNATLNTGIVFDQSSGRWGQALIGTNRGPRVPIGIDLSGGIFSQCAIRTPRSCIP